MTFLIQNIEDLPASATQLLAIADQQKIWLLKGRIGAGKTTLLQEVGHQLGIEDDITSPSYSLVNEYRIAHTDESVYHIDLYRLKSLEEAWQMGLEEYLFSGSRCWVEWPELLEPILEELDAVTIEITILPDSSRKVLILENS